ncbi:hypothetical protein DWB77_00004 [Streptomyces hundungensis]|uniref:Uncharacterized protein n=1 Tax=Streptomyces hundungensis TaxID=1077946 RepID=A0A387HAV5_9ACTN|nr:hypothetical protein DWB77_00004 [Streptomyces hundungensis]
MITITHTHAEGTLADGTSKGDGSGDVLKRYGFRWMPSIGMYGIPGTIDRAARRCALHRAATDLRAAGFDTELTVDDTPRPYDIVQAAARAAWTSGAPRSVGAPNDWLRSLLLCCVAPMSWSTASPWGSRFFPVSAVAGTARHRPGRPTPSSRPVPPGVRPSGRPTGCKPL